jgi:hypothetical protein
MNRTNLKAAAIVLAAMAIACAWPMHARAQDVAGAYCLVGVMEVGSCIKLSAGGKFEYFLAYGAYDESSQGTWRLEGGRVVVDSLAYDKRPTFTFKRMQRGEGNPFDVIVENKAGRALQLIDVSVTCDGRTARSGSTGASGFRIACANAPTQVLLGISMYGLAPQTIDVAGRAGADKTYVFEFDPGDLGRKKFTAHRLTPDGRDLVMTYTDTSIRELDGRTFRYQRQ